MFLFSLSSQTITCVFGLNALESDPENDVYRMHQLDTDRDLKKGDYHDEIDIVKLEIMGQHINLSFAVNLTNWESNECIYTQAIIILHEDFQGIHNIPLDLTFPYYAVVYDNSTGLGFKVYLSHVTENYTKYWDNSVWTDDQNLAMEIGYASDNSITVDIPLTAYMLPSNITILATVVAVEQYGPGFREVIAYFDIAPNKYDPFALEDEISSFNLFIILFGLIGISLIIIKNQTRNK